MGWCQFSKANTLLIRTNRWHSKPTSSKRRLGLANLPMPSMAHLTGPVTKLNQGLVFAQSGATAIHGITC